MYSVPDAALRMHDLDLVLVKFVVGHHVAGTAAAMYLRQEETVEDYPDLDPVLSLVR